MNAEEVLLSGRITKEKRASLRAGVGRVAASAKKREILRNQWFTLAKGLLAAGAEPARVLDGLEDLLRLMDGAEGATGEVRIGFSPGGDCKRLIMDHLAGARKSLHICVFTISDNEIADLIIDRHREGLPVRVISDNEKAEDEGSDIHHMMAGGVPIRIDRTPDHMHHKFSVADGQEVLTGSYNWTRSAERSNQENLLVMRDAAVAMNYATAFDNLWNALAPDNRADRHHA